MEKTVLPPSDEVNRALEACGASPIRTGARLADLLRRPEVHYDSLTAVDPTRPDYPKAVFENVEIELKYAGYIERQRAAVAEMRRLENRALAARHGLCLDHGPAHGGAGEAEKGAACPRWDKPRGSAA